MATKAPETQPSNSPSHSSKPFFSKNEEEVFFAQPEENKTLFFSSYSAPAIQKITDDEEEELGELVDDDATYYVIVPDATIRKNDDPNHFTSNAIPQGVKVQRLSVYTLNNGKSAWRVEIKDLETNSGVSVGDKYWTTSTNVEISETIADESKYHTLYNDTLVFHSPTGKKKTEVNNTTGQTLSVDSDTGYKKAERCHGFVKVQLGEEEVGWVMENRLVDQTEKSNIKKLEEYRDWLNGRYSEITALATTEKISRTKGLLSQVEEVCHRLEQGVYPNLDTLSKTPSFEEHDYRSFVPPILAAQVRQFIQLLETTAVDSNSSEAGEEPADQPAAETALPEDTASTSTEASTASAETAPSATEEAETPEVADWNARLGVPQYRTQSDNLTPPEVTCAPTSFTMAVERLGYSREDMIRAIDEELTGHRKKEYRKQLWKETQYRKEQYLESEEGQNAVQSANGGEVAVPETFMPDPVVPSGFVLSEAMPDNFMTTVGVPKGFEPETAYPEANLKSKWKEKGKAFFESLTGTNYWQKLRSGVKGGLVGDEEDVAENFRDYGQYEDFSYFLAYLNNIGRGSIPSQENTQSLINKLDNPGGSNNLSNVQRIDLAANNEEFGVEHREKVRATLAAGGAVILSLRHKGISSTDTHVVTVRNVSSDGLELDDPFGQINPEYRRKSGVVSDAYKDTGGTGYRSAYDWKNVPHFDKDESDYNKRDFTATAAEDLEADESRGVSSKISWKMIDESKFLINYFVLINKP